jgi:hypothetical protein
MNTNVLDGNASQSSSTTIRKNVRYFWLDIVLLLLVGATLYYGSFWKSLDVHSVAAQQTDVARYACYTAAFWHGYAGLSELPEQQCAFITHPTSTTPVLSSASVLKKLTTLGAPVWLTDFVALQAPTQPLHALPSEYPLIVMVPFSLAGLAPPIYYQLAFAVVMLVLLATIYLVLMRFAGRWTACAFLLLLFVGGWGTALGRFDLFPAALTLCALLCAERARWNYAFALLALAALAKIYPILLVPAFLIAQQRPSTGKWLTWRRWQAPALFLALCVGVSAVSLLLSVAGTLAPLSYFGNRPIQVESVASSLLWLAHTLGGYPLTFGFSFGSRNMFSPLSPLISTGGTVLLVAGLLYTLWLQWRGKITLAMSSLLILLVIIYTGKVFSAQYLIWIAPIMAYVSRGKRRWLIGWGCISFVTTLIYPFLYERPNFPFGPYLPDFYLTVFVRNALFSIFLAVLLYVVSRRPAAVGRSSSVADTGL